MKVSIITVVYNNAAGIADCIESVLRQSYPYIEHIVIDGGSKDGTQNMIAPFIDRLGYYISEKDKGLYNALNKGIRKATGDIVGILHSDDLFFNSDTIQNVVNEFMESNADLIYGHGIYVDQKDVSVVKRVYKAAPFRRKYLFFGWIPLHTTIFVKREVFDQWGLYLEHFSISSDYEISLRWFLEPTIQKHFLDLYLVKMRIGGKSTSAVTQKKKSLEDMSIIYQYSLPGMLTLAFKITRKIPQYLKPRIIPKRYHDSKLEQRSARKINKGRNYGAKKYSLKRIMTFWL